MIIELLQNKKYYGYEGIILKDDKLKEIMHKKLSPIEYEKWISLKAEENDVCDEFFEEFNEKAEYAWGVDNGRKQSI